MHAACGVVCVLVLLLLPVVSGRCPAEWHELDGRCYRMLQKQVSWGDANKQCLGLGGELASFASAVEARKAMNAMCSGLGFWVGYKNTSQGWSWLGNSEWNPWSDGVAPSSSECGVMQRSDARMYPTRCEGSIFIDALCSRPAVLGDTGWVERSGFLYALSSAAPAEKVLEECRALHPDASPFLAEAEDFSFLAQQYFCEYEVWTGVSLKEGSCAAVRFPVVFHRSEVVPSHCGVRRRAVCRRVVAPPEPTVLVMKPAQRERNQNVIVVTAGISMVSPFVASTAKLLVVNDLKCGLDGIDFMADEPMGPEFHPLGLGLGAHANRYFMGAVVCNVLLVVTALGVLVLLGRLQSCFLGTSLPRALGRLKAPGAVFLPTLFLIQGTSLAASNLAFFPCGSPWYASAVGWIVLLSCALLPYALWRYLLRPDRFRAMAVPDKKEWSRPVVQWLYTYFYGPEYWVNSLYSAEYFVERFGLVFELYRPGCQYYPMVEIWESLSLSLISAWRPETSAMCSVRNSIICLLFFVFLCLLLHWRPYNTGFDNAVAISSSAAVLVAVLLMAISVALQSKGDPTPALLMYVAGWTLLTATLVLLIRAVVIIICFVISRLCRWRSDTTYHPELDEYPSDVDSCEMEPRRAVQGRPRLTTSFVGVGCEGEEELVAMTNNVAIIPLGRPLLQTSAERSKATSKMSTPSLQGGVVANPPAQFVELIRSPNHPPSASSREATVSPPRCLSPQSLLLHTPRWLPRTSTSFTLESGGRHPDGLCTPLLDDVAPFPLPRDTSLLLDRLATPRHPCVPVSPSPEKHPPSPEKHPPSPEKHPPSPEKKPSLPQASEEGEEEEEEEEHEEEEDEIDAGVLVRAPPTDRRPSLPLNLLAERRRTLPAPALLSFAGDHRTSREFLDLEEEEGPSFPPLLPTSLAAVHAARVAL